jgi:ABC-type glycerol-3-phosphate transport system substrate-binding protein
MHQIKIFKTLEYDYEAMEKQINDWLAKTGVKVLSISGNIAPQSETGAKMGAGSASGGSPSDMVLFLLYEKP